MKEYIGNLHVKDAHVAIIIGRFNEMITKSLLEGSLDGLRRHGVDDKNISTAWVPGAFELPLVAKRLAFSKNFDAIICLGAIIRGATPHFDFVASQTASGIAQASLESGIPIIFGVLTTDTIEQAVERAGTKSGNKGFDSALAAIEMINLLNQLPGSKGK